MTKSQYAIQCVATDMAVNIIERIKKDFGLTDSGLIDFLTERGTSHLLNDDALLFTSIHDEEDETYRIFLGELPYGDVGKKEWN